MKSGSSESINCTLVNYLFTGTSHFSGNYFGILVIKACDSCCARYWNSMCIEAGDVGSACSRFWCDSTRLTIWGSTSLRSSTATSSKSTEGWAQWSAGCKCFLLCRSHRKSWTGARSCSTRCTSWGARWMGAWSSKATTATERGKFNSSFCQTSGVFRHGRIICSTTKTTSSWRRTYRCLGCCWLCLRCSVGWKHADREQRYCGEGDNGILLIEVHVRKGKTSNFKFQPFLLIFG